MTARIQETKSDMLGFAEGLTTSVKELGDKFESKLR
jgi:hypothetical protein